MSESEEKANLFAFDERQYYWVSYAHDVMSESEEKANLFAFDERRYYWVSYAHDIIANRDFSGCGLVW